MTEHAHTPPELPQAAALSLASLIDYQPGAVASRTLLKPSGGIVRIFAFDSGQGLTEHTAPFDAIAQAIEGEATITVAGKAVPVVAGEIVLLPGKQPHAVSARSRFKMLLTMIRSV